MKTDHTATLQNRITQLEDDLDFYKGVLPKSFGKSLLNLYRALIRLDEAAKVGRGATWDESRGSGDPISHDGKSTSAGRGTLGARRRLEYWVRRVDGIIEAVGNDLDPMSQRVGDARPRCGRRACDGRGRRQPVGVRLCGFCGEPMGGKSRTND